MSPLLRTGLYSLLSASSLLLAACSGGSSSGSTVTTTGPGQQEPIDLGRDPYPAAVGSTSLHQDFTAQQKPYAFRSLAGSDVQTGERILLSAVVGTEQQSQPFALQLPEGNIELLHSQADDPSQEIYTSSGSDSFYRDESGSLYRYNNASGQSLIGEVTVAAGDYWLSDDQQYLLFISEVLVDGSSSFYRYELASQQLRQLDQNLSGTQLGASDTAIKQRPLIVADQVLFIKRQTEGGTTRDNLYVSDLDGANRQQLNTALLTEQGAFALAVTPDQQAVVYQIAVDSGEVELWLSKLDGSGSRLLSSGLSLTSVITKLVQLDNDRVVFQRGNGLYAAALDGSGIVKISGDKKVNKAIAADGKLFFSTLLSFGSNSEPETLYQLQNSGELVALNAADAHHSLEYGRMQYVASLDAVIYDKYKVDVAVPYRQPVLTYLDGTTEVVELEIPTGFSSLSYRYVAEADGLFMQTRHGSNPLSLSRFYVSDINGDNLVRISPLTSAPGKTAPPDNQLVAWSGGDVLFTHGENESLFRFNRATAAATEVELGLENFVADELLEVKTSANAATDFVLIRNQQSGLERIETHRMDTSQRCEINIGAGGEVSLAGDKAIAQANGNYLFYQVMYSAISGRSNDLRRLDSRNCNDRSIAQALTGQTALSVPMAMTLLGEDRLLLVNDRANLLSIKLDGSGLQQLNNQSGETYRLMHNASFGSVAEQRLFVAQAENSQSQGVLILTDNEGNNARQLNPEGSNLPAAAKFKISTDQQWVYYRAQVAENAPFSLYKSSLSEEQNIALANNLNANLLSDWHLSDNGEYLIAAANYQDKTSLVKVPTDGSGMILLSGFSAESFGGATPFKGVDADKSWLVTADDQLIYAGQSDEGRVDIFSVDLDGSNPQQLTSVATIAEEIIDFGWFGNTLAVQAEYDQDKALVYVQQQNGTFEQADENRKYSGVVQVSEEELVLLDNSDGGTIIRYLVDGGVPGLLGNVNEDVADLRLRADGSYTLLWRPKQGGATRAEVYSWSSAEE